MATFCVTGGTGFLGSNVIWELLRCFQDRPNDLQLIWFGRGTPEEPLASRIGRLAEGAFLSSLPPGADPTRLLGCIKAVEVDLMKDGLGLDPESLRFLQGQRIDGIVHAAASTDLRRSRGATQRLAECNVAGTRRLLHLVRSLKKDIGTFVYVSSAFVCGRTKGDVSPDFRQDLGLFRNPYEESKFTAEFLCRDFCRIHRIRLKIFRPSIIGGRTIERPFGHVTKYEMFYQWMKFFVLLKRKMLPGANWDAVLNTAVDVPLRIAFNPEGHLNIVPVDFCAKVIAHSLLGEEQPSAHHLASETDVLNADLFRWMLENVNVRGCVSVPERPRDADMNAYEKLYYATVGDVFFPYVSDNPFHFNTNSLTRFCEKSGLDLPRVDATTFGRMVAFARDNHFGCE